MLVALVAMSLPLAGNAALGPLKVKSSLNEEFSGVIAVTGTEADIILENPQAVGITGNGLSVTPVRDGKKVYLKVRSDRRVTNPIVNFTVNVADRSQTYSTLIDMAKLNKPATSTSAVKAVKLPPEKIGATVSLGSLSDNPGAMEANVVMRDTYVPFKDRVEDVNLTVTETTGINDTYLVKENDTLAKIAKKFRPRGATVKQTANAIYNLNKEAFLYGDRDLLLKGRRIAIPNIDDIRFMTNGRVGSSGKARNARTIAKARRSYANSANTSEIRMLRTSAKERLDEAKKFLRQTRNDIRLNDDYRRSVLSQMIRDNRPVEERHAAIKEDKEMAASQAKVLVAAEKELNRQYRSIGRLSGNIDKANQIENENRQQLDRLLDDVRSTTENRKSAALSRGLDNYRSKLGLDSGSEGGVPPKKSADVGSRPGAGTGDMPPMGEQGEVGSGDADLAKANADQAANQARLDEMKKKLEAERAEQARKEAERKAAEEEAQRKAAEEAERKAAEEAERKAAEEKRQQELAEQARKIQEQAEEQKRKQIEENARKAQEDLAKRNEEGQQGAETQTPPVGGEEQPPVGGEEQPPVGGEEQPPVGGEEQPPVGGDEQPPVGGDEQPPVGGDEQPPVGGEEQPPVEETKPEPAPESKPAPKPASQPAPVEEESLLSNPLVLGGGAAALLLLLGGGAYALSRRKKNGPSDNGPSGPKGGPSPDDDGGKKSKKGGLFGKKKKEDSDEEPKSKSWKKGKKKGDEAADESMASMPPVPPMADEEEDFTPPPVPPMQEAEEYAPPPPPGAGGDDYVFDTPQQNEQWTQAPESQPAFDTGSYGDTGMGSQQNFMDASQGGMGSSDSLGMDLNSMGGGASDPFASQQASSDPTDFVFDDGSANAQQGGGFDMNAGGGFGSDGGLDIDLGSTGSGSSGDAMGGTSFGGDEVFGGGMDTTPPPAPETSQGGNEGFNPDVLDFDTGSTQETNVAAMPMGQETPEPAAMDFGADLDAPSAEAPADFAQFDEAAGADSAAAQSGLMDFDTAASETKQPEPFSADSLNLDTGAPAADPFDLSSTPSTEAEYLNDNPSAADINAAFEEAAAPSRRKKSVEDQLEESAKQQLGFDDSIDLSSLMGGGGGLDSLGFAESGSQPQAEAAPEAPSFDIPAPDTAGTDGGLDFGSFDEPAPEAAPEATEVPTFDLGAAPEVPEAAEVPAFDLGAAPEVPEASEVPSFDIPAAPEVPETQDSGDMGLDFAAFDEPAAEAPAEPAAEEAPISFDAPSMEPVADAAPEAAPDFSAFDDDAKSGGDEIQLAPQEDTGNLSFDAFDDMMGGDDMGDAMSFDTTAPSEPPVQQFAEPAAAAPAPEPEVPQFEPAKAQEEYVPELVSQQKSIFTHTAGVDVGEFTANVENIDFSIPLQVKLDLADMYIDQNDSESALEALYDVLDVTDPNSQAYQIAKSKISQLESAA